MTIVIIPDRLSDIGAGNMIGKAPISQDDARTWGEEHGAEAVIYWPPTQTAYIHMPKAEPEWTVKEATND